MRFWGYAAVRLCGFGVDRFLGVEVDGRGFGGGLVSR